MKRTLALKAERLVELTAEELQGVAGAEPTAAGCIVTTLPTVCVYVVVPTFDSCLTGDYSVAC
jgi:hypothetical protein